MPLPCKDTGEDGCFLLGCNATYGDGVNTGHIVRTAAGNAVRLDGSAAGEQVIDATVRNAAVDDICALKGNVKGLATPNIYCLDIARGDEVKGAVLNSNFAVGVIAVDLNCRRIAGIVEGAVFKDNFHRCAVIHASYRNIGIVESTETEDVLTCAASVRTDLNHFLGIVGRRTCMAGC